jgi:hypothetical protein
MDEDEDEDEDEMEEEDYMEEADEHLGQPGPSHCHAWYALHTMTYTIRNIEGDD